MIGEHEGQSVAIADNLSDFCGDKSLIVPQKYVQKTQEIGKISGDDCEVGIELESSKLMCDVIRGRCFTEKDIDAAIDSLQELKSAGKKFT